jgi:hypothetical protein
MLLSESRWCGQFVVLVSFKSRSQRIRPLGRNPSRAIPPRSVVVRKTSPTTSARRQPEQVIITGSEGELIICPPDSDGTLRRRGTPRKRISKGAKRQLKANFGSASVSDTRLTQTGYRTSEEWPPLATLFCAHNAPKLIAHTDHHARDQEKNE